MCKVVLLTWTPGLNKITLNHLLRKKTGMTLSQAKKCVDDLIEGRNPEVQLVSYQQSEEFLQDIQTLGITGRIDC